jgi:hypothetical protein
MKRNTTTDQRLLGFLPTKESWGGIKKYTTRSAEMAVEVMPADLPPMRELKNAVGKKRNQTKGLNTDHNCHCAQQDIKGSNRASAMLVIPFLFVSIDAHPSSLGNEMSRCIVLP